MTGSRSKSWRVRAQSSLLRASRAADLAWNAFWVVREELALALCDANTRTVVTADVYRHKTHYLAGSQHNRDGLFAFERSAMRRFFPPAPARILVGACGGGREVLALRAAGHVIAGAYDPSPDLVDSLRSELLRLGETIPAWVASHEALATDAVALSIGQVDAVVVGWGSYTHLLGAQRRIAFLRNLRVLCARGPVLLSYFAANPTGEGRRRARWRTMTRSILHQVPWLDTQSIEEGDSFQPDRGFSHWFTDDEIRNEADASGYDVLHIANSDEAFPHAVLVPRPGSPRAVGQ